MSKSRKIHRIARRDGSYRCHYCRINLDLNKVTLDHKFPQALGGNNSDENLVISCMKCNQKKGYIPYDEWMERRKPKLLGIKKPDGKFLEPKINA